MDIPDQVEETQSITLISTLWSLNFGVVRISSVSLQLLCFYIVFKSLFYLQL